MASCASCCGCAAAGLCFTGIFVVARGPQRKRRRRPQEEAAAAAPQKEAAAPQPGAPAASPASEAPPPAPVAAKKNGETANKSRELYDAAWMGDFDGAFEAMEAGADPAKGFGPRKITALHVAARTDNKWILGMLLKSGRVPFDVQNRDGETALFGAVVEGNVGATQLLIDARADINHRDGTGKTVLAVAQARGMQKFVEFLQANGGTV
uniref:Ankyrin repeat domain-containing protein n=1 Tax=Alexandrium monilatum TaxID=311494 RepID=A0A7S4S1U8_9DINO|mmetsp:Transcript_77661/g.231423  ORF Transcript_77661/g.231423 Transcript_77661/m.231423 type:complete len:209 (+) Transcript_77661:106-732(+)